MDIKWCIKCIQCISIWKYKSIEWKCGGGWEIQPSTSDAYGVPGLLYGKSKTGGAPGFAYFMFLQPYDARKNWVEETWVFSGQRADINSSGQEQPISKVFWYLEGGGTFWTEGDITCYGTVSAASSSIIVSDRNKKHDINELPEELTKSFILNLKPVLYKYNDGTSDRTHWGMISQDVEETLNLLNIDTKDFAGFVKSPHKEIHYEAILDEKGNLTYDEEGNLCQERIEEIIEGEYDYSLRYEEFIAPIIKTVQIQQNEIVELKESIKQQQQEFNKFKNDVEIILKTS